MTTAAISREQYANARGERRGRLASRIMLLLEDCRGRAGREDWLLSAEMIEAAGGRLLAPHLRPAAGC